MKDLLGYLTLPFCLATAMVCHTIYGSLEYAFLAFCFAPFAWCKWLVCHEVNLTVIKHTFEFLLK